MLGARVVRRAPGDERARVVVDGWLTWRRRLLVTVTVALFGVCVALWGAYAVHQARQWNAPPPALPTPQVTPTAVPQR